MKKKAKFIPYVLFSSLRMILTSMALSLAWFVSLAKLDPTGDASATGAYFAYGNGSQEKPFGISQPRHLYNLAWLQYMGKFNKTDSDTGKKQTYYFELAGDIDRTDYALPPIGTKTYPFIGSFNGNSHKITGLTISNNLDDFHQRPYSGVKESDFPEQINIVGFFGVVGSYENTAGINYDTSANQIVDTGLVDLTVKSSSRTTLAGLAAGYVNGKLQGVAVNDSSFQFKQNTSPTTITNNLSDYSLVGYVKDKTYLREREKSTSTTNAPSIDNPIAGQGDGEWGSSIDRRSRFKNLHQKYIKAEFPTYTTYEEVKWDSSTSSWTPIPSTKQESTESNPIDDNYYFVSSDAGKDSKGSSVKTASYTFSTTTSYHGTKNRDTDPYVGLSGELSSANYTYLKRQITDLWAKDTFILSDKTGTNYLSATRSNRYSNAPQVSLINTKNKEKAIHLYLNENNNQLYFSLNDRIFYIGVAGNRLTVSRNIPSSVWTYDSAHSLLVSEGKYLVFDGLSWTIFSTPENEIVFDYDSVNNSRDSYIFSNDNNDRYRCLPDDKTDFMDTTTDKSKAAKWIIDKDNGNKIYALDGTTKYYLYYKTQGDWWNPWQIPFVTTNINDTSISSSNTSGYIVWESNHFVSTYRYRDYKLYYSAKLSDTELATYGRWSRNSQAKCSVSGTFKYQCQKIDSPSSSFTNSTDVIETRNKLNPTYFPLTFDETGTFPSDKNTGYVVSGAKYNDSDKNSVGDIRVASAYKTTSVSYDERVNKGKIGNTLNNSRVRRDTTFSNSNFFAYTIKQNSSEASSDNKIKIGDPINKQENTSGYTSYSTLGFKKYYRYILNEASGSRVARGNLLTADPIAYGLHFRNAEISKNNLTTVDYAKINGQEYYGYQLPNNAIDFNLKGEGYINFFAATYFYQSDDNWQTKYNNCFFSLHVIERDGNIINSIKEISKIYQNQSASVDKAQPSYVYEYTDGTTDTGIKDASGNFIPGTKGTLLFDTRVLTNPDLDKEWENNAAYYFEIPVNKGEFALGSVSGKDKNGAYLRYLDIGAGNKDDNNITIEEHTEIEVKTYSYPYGVDFHSFTSSATVQDSYSDIEGGKSSAVRISSVSGKGTEFQFSYSSSDRSTVLNVTGPPSSCKGTYLSPGVLLKNSGSDLDVVESDTTHTVVIDKLTKYALPDSDDATSLKGTSQITMTVDGKTSTREESETFSLECTTAEAKNILEFSNDSGEKLFTIDYSIVKPKKENTGTEWTYDDPIKLVLFYNPKTRRYHVSFIGKDTSLEIMASMTYFNSSLTRNNSTSGFAGVRIDNYSTEKTIDLNKTYTFKAKTSA